jgi:hypothetical protein
MDDVVFISPLAPGAQDIAQCEISDGKNEESEIAVQDVAHWPLVEITMISTDRRVMVKRRIGIMCDAPDLFWDMTRRGIEISSDHEKFVSERRWLCDNLSSPKGWGANGQDHPVSGASCARLRIEFLKAKDITGDFTLSSGRHSLTDQEKMLGRDFLAGAPIDDSGRSYGHHSGRFGGSTKGFDYVFD